ncbi:RNA-directed DNA polymerase from mobile element jockey-like protein [Elysia marginata]|uniref:RNA-directed DNA polymerase from mobile element jockey-like protein n=1 Tax=Elysia marginata TaxID=1093978 RepID=A0AAV4HK66_9GAST|nr:RNA-directed DNA polymerase from mobile element jockey-like protein [Elysia marginata]
MVLGVLLGIELPPLVLAAVTLLVILVVKSWTSSPANLPPCPARPFPVLGHLVHLRKDARRVMMEWRKQITRQIPSLRSSGTINREHPVYLGVTLDRTLSFSQHAMNVKAKVAARNSLLRKLANSNWGADPKTLRTTALALSYSTAEYSSAVWARSCHAKKVEAELKTLAAL